MMTPGRMLAAHHVEIQPLHFCSTLHWKSKSSMLEKLHSKRTENPLIRKSKVRSVIITITVNSENVTRKSYEGKKFITVILLSPYYPLSKNIINFIFSVSLKSSLILYKLQMENRGTKLLPFCQTGNQNTEPYPCSQCLIF